MATVGELIVKLSASTASFARDLDKARQLAFGNAKEIERSFRLIGKAVAGVGVAIGTSLAFMAKQQIDLADQLLETSQKVGVSVEALSALSHGAKQSGVDLDGLATGLKFLNRSMVDAAAGGKEQAAAFQALGVSFKDADGKLRSGEAVLMDVAGAFSGLNDGAAKTEIAMRLFGKAGADLIPFLNSGKEGLAAYRAEAEKLGAVISTDFAKKADAFKDSLERIEARVRGVANVFAGLALEGLGMWDREVEASTRRWNVFHGLPVPPQMNARVKAIQEMGAATKDANTATATAALLQAKAGGAVKEHKDRAAEFIATLREKLAALKVASEGTLLYEAALRKASAAQMEDVRALALAIQHQRLWNELKERAGRITAPKIPRAETPDLDVPDVPLPEIPEELPEILKGVKLELETINPLLREMGQNFQIIGENALAGIGDALLGLTSWKQLARQVLADLGRMVFYLMIVRPLMAALFGGTASSGLGVGVSGFFGALFGGTVRAPAGTVPPRQHGGPVWPGQGFVVGERGPELFVPRMAGEIISSGRGMGGTVVNNNIDARGADLGVLVRIQAAMTAMGQRQFAEQLFDRAARVV